jgi:hypothetical protein
MLPGVLALALVAGTGGYFALRGDAPADDAEKELVEAQPVCKIEPDILQAVRNGYVPGRSGDVLAIEQPPNQFGTRHSSPHPLHQDVPLLLYGPGFIRSGEIGTDATVADLSPTFAELLGFDAYPTAERDGKVLEEALLAEEQRNGVPKLIVTLVWDGGGDNVLEQWPDAWPELAELMRKSAVYPNATVGSSPSITPAIHASIGTGTFPQIHGLPDTRIRVRGKMVDAWEGSSPRYLRVKTLGDLWDAANGNSPLVGMMARDAWHLGMIGHGAYLPEGDLDIAVMDQLGAVNFRTNADYYSMPDYVNLDGLEDAVATVDRRDGELDGRWLGNPLLPYDGAVRATPAWSVFQTQKLLELLGNEGFGADDVPDLFYVNYKAIDLAGHAWNMVDPEVEDNVVESDAQLPLILDWLDANVGENNYVLAFTADHGMTPLPSVTKGWGIEVSDMTRDLERRFDRKTPNVPLVLSNRGYQIMLNHNELRRNDVTAEDVAEWVRDYRIRDNVTKTNTVLPRFRGRTDERLYLTALTPDELDDALECARERRDDQARVRRDLHASLAARARKSGLPKR